MRYFWLALLLPAATPGVARAQGACADIAKFFAHPPTVGEWVEMTSQGQVKEGDPDTVRMAVIKTEQRNGKTMYWFQLSMTQEGKHDVIQMLAPWDMNAMPGSNAVEVVVKLGDQPAMKASGSALGKNLTNQADWREYCAKSKFVGQESVKVPAGTFRARHYQNGNGGDTWASLQVPLWHIVKMTTKDGNTMVLSAKGTGAKNEITEQPVDMSHMMANPEAAQKMKEEMEKQRH